MLIRLDPTMTDEEWRAEIEKLVVELADRHPELQQEAGAVLLESRRLAKDAPRRRADSRFGPRGLARPGSEGGRGEQGPELGARSPGPSAIQEGAHQ